MADIMIDNWTLQRAAISINDTYEKISSPNEEYNGHQVAKKTGAEDADSRRADQTGKTAQESQHGSGCRTRNLLTAYGWPD